MKKYLVILLAFLLVGCGKKTIEQTPVSSTETSTSEVNEKVPLRVYLPDYNLEEKSFLITGVASKENRVTAKKNGEDNKLSDVSKNGSISYSGKLSEDAYEIIFSDGEDSITIEIKSISQLEKENADKEAKLAKSEQEEKEAKEKEKAEQDKIDQERDNKEDKENEEDEEDEEIDTTVSLLEYQKEGMKNADRYPAKQGAILFDKKERKFKGMNYYFDGEIIGEVKLKNVTDGKAWLVKNSNGYVLPVEYYYFEASNGDKVKIWGTLSGLQFSNSDLGVDNVVGATGSMHALSVERNGETLY